MGPNELEDYKFGTCEKHQSDSRNVPEGRECSLPWRAGSDKRVDWVEQGAA